MNLTTLTQTGAKDGAAGHEVDRRSDNMLNRRAPTSMFETAAAIIFWIIGILIVLRLFTNLYPLFVAPTVEGGLRIDFLAFWAAAKLALAGQPLAPFDIQALVESAGLSPEDQSIRWLYPASFLVVLMPLGALSFPAAYLLFTAISITALALAIRAPASVLPGLWRLMLVAPIAVSGPYMIGQTGTLWTAGLIAALWAMRSGNVVAAGLAIALLTMKPQLGLLIPVALIAGRQWGVILWAAIATILLTVVATLLTDPDYWMMFYNSLDDRLIVVGNDTFFIHFMLSFYSFMRELGLAHDTAMSSQLALTIALMAIIGWVWSRQRISFDLKCATLCAAIPLAAPYAFYFEMIIELGAFLFLIRDGFGKQLAAKAWLLVLWVGHVPAVVLAPDITVALYAPPVMLITLAICLIRARNQLRDTTRLAPNETPCPAT